MAEETTTTTTITTTVESPQESKLLSVGCQSLFGGTSAQFQKVTKGPGPNVIPNPRDSIVTLVTECVSKDYQGEYHEVTIIPKRLFTVNKTQTQKTTETSEGPREETTTATTTTTTIITAPRWLYSADAVLNEINFIVTKYAQLVPLRGFPLWEARYFCQFVWGQESETRSQVNPQGAPIPVPMYDYMITSAPYPPPVSMSDLVLKPALEVLQALLVDKRPTQSGFPGATSSTLSSELLERFELLYLPPERETWGIIFQGFHSFLCYLAQLAVVVRNGQLMFGQNHNELLSSTGYLTDTWISCLYEQKDQWRAMGITVGPSPSEGVKELLFPSVLTRGLTPYVRPSVRSTMKFSYPSSVDKITTTLIPTDQLPIEGYGTYNHPVGEDIAVSPMASAKQALWKQFQDTGPSSLEIRYYDPQSVPRDQEKQVVINRRLLQEKVPVDWVGYLDPTKSLDQQPSAKEFGLNPVEYYEGTDLSMYLIDLLGTLPNGRASPFNEMILGYMVLYVKVSSRLNKERGEKTMSETQLSDINGWNQHIADMLNHLQSVIFALPATPRRSQESPGGAGEAPKERSLPFRALYSLVIKGRTMSGRNLIKNVFTLPLPDLNRFLGTGRAGETDLIRYVGATQAVREKMGISVTAEQQARQQKLPALLRGWPNADVVMRFYAEQVLSMPFYSSAVQSVTTDNTYDVLLPWNRVGEIRSSIAPMSIEKRPCRDPMWKRCGSKIQLIPSEITQKRLAELQVREEERERRLAEEATERKRKEEEERKKKEEEETRRKTEDEARQKEQEKLREVKKDVGEITRLKYGSTEFVSALSRLIEDTKGWPEAQRIINDVFVDPKYRYERPSLPATAGHKTVQRKKQIQKKSSHQYTADKRPCDDLKAKEQGGDGNGDVTVKQQTFLREYFTVDNRVTQGLLLWHAPGSGKLCTALAITETLTDSPTEFQLLWVTSQDQRYLPIKDIVQTLCFSKLIKFKDTPKFKELEQAYKVMVSLLEEIEDPSNLFAEFVDSLPDDAMKQNFAFLKRLHLEGSQYGSIVSYQRFYQQVLSKNPTDSGCATSGGKTSGKQKFDLLCALQKRPVVAGSTPPQDSLRKVLLVIDDAHKPTANDPEMPDFYVKLRKWVMHSRNVSGESDTCRVILLTNDPMTFKTSALFDMLAVLTPRKRGSSVERADTTFTKPLSDFFIPAGSNADTIEVQACGEAWQGACVAKANWDHFLQETKGIISYVDPRRDLRYFPAVEILDVQYATMANPQLTAIQGKIATAVGMGESAERALADIRKFSNISTDEKNGLKIDNSGLSSGLTPETLGYAAKTYIPTNECLSKKLVQFLGFVTELTTRNIGNKEEILKSIGSDRLTKIELPGGTNISNAFYGMKHVVYSDPGKDAIGYGINAIGSALNHISVSVPSGGQSLKFPLINLDWLLREKRVVENKPVFMTLPETKIEYEINSDLWAMPNHTGVVILDPTLYSKWSPQTSDDNDAKMKKQDLWQKAKRKVLEAFNDPKNALGNYIKFLLIDRDALEGGDISLEDVKYVHFFEPPEFEEEYLRVMGRVLRFCKSNYLPWGLNPKEVPSTTLDQKPEKVSLRDGTPWNATGTQIDVIPYQSVFLKDNPTVDPPVDPRYQSWSPYSFWRTQKERLASEKGKGDSNPFVDERRRMKLRAASMVAAIDRLLFQCINPPLYCKNAPELLALCQTGSGEDSKQYCVCDEYIGVCIPPNLPPWQQIEYAQGMYRFPWPGTGVESPKDTFPQPPPEVRDYAREFGIPLSVPLNQVDPQYIIDRGQEMMKSSQTIIDKKYNEALTLESGVNISIDTIKDKISKAKAEVVTVEAVVPASRTVPKKQKELEDLEKQFKEAKTMLEKDKEFKTALTERAKIRIQLETLLYYAQYPPERYHAVGVTGTQQKVSTVTPPPRKPSSQPVSTDLPVQKPPVQKPPVRREPSLRPESPKTPSSEKIPTLPPETPSPVQSALSPSASMSQEDIGKRYFGGLTSPLGNGKCLTIMYDPDKDAYVAPLYLAIILEAVNTIALTDQPSPDPEMGPLGAFKFDDDLTREDPNQIQKIFFDKFKEELKNVDTGNINVTKFEDIVNNKSALCQSITNYIQKNPNTLDFPDLFKPTRNTAPQQTA